MQPLESQDEQLRERTLGHKLLHVVLGTLKQRLVSQ